MRALFTLSAALGVAMLALPASTRAQFGARAEIDPPIAAGSDLDPTSSATTIELDDRPRALETTDEVLLEVPGARRRRSGGFGGFTALSLRGAEAEHTTVLLGDVPLSSADGSAFDLSTVPPWLFDRIEVYRGGAPVWLGAGAIGGVLRLVPRSGRGRTLEAVGGGGSWDLAQGRVGASVDDGEVSWATVAGITHSSGAFPISIEETPLDPDREELTQSNAQVLETAGLVHARLRAGGGTLSLVGLGLERVGGEPAPVTRWTPDSQVHRTHTRGVIALAGEWLEGGRPPEQADLAEWRAQVTGSFGFDRRSFDDPHAQYGQTPRATDELLMRASLRAAGSLRLTDWLGTTLVLAGWHEAFDPSDPLALEPLSSSRRDGGIAALEGRFHGREGDVRWELRPSARIELVDSQLAAIRADLDHRSRFDAMPTARLGGVVEFVPGIALQASVASATRAPSFIELFGDGGLIAGSTDLRPEQSTSVDAGLVARGRAGPIEGFAEVRGFGLWMTDLIRYVRTPANQWTPQNVASAWVAGTEASTNVDIARTVSLIGSLTWLESRDEGRGRALPFRPRLTFYGRAAVHVPGPAPLGRASVWIDMDYVSATPDTPENWPVIPEVARAGVGASVELWDGALRVDLIVRDVFDARGRDAHLRPLPGRSFALQIAARTN